MRSIPIRKNKLLARVYDCTNVSKSSVTPQEILQDVTKNINNLAVGYAGFSKKKYLRELLSQQMFDDDTSAVQKGTEINGRQEILAEVKGGLLKAGKLLPITRPLYIYIFPSYSDFIKTKMGGVSGYTPWKDTILIFLSNHREARTLEKTIVHEYVHAVSRQFHSWTTLGDSLVFEGLAENFISIVYKNFESPWVSGITRSAAFKYLNEITSQLDATDGTLEYEVFFEDKRYPLWSGYAIGFHLVHKFINEHKSLSWQGLIAKKPSDILNDFLC